MNDPRAGRELRIVVASGNPVKRRAVAIASQRLFAPRRIQILALVVPSGVADQPMTDGETRRGAVERARAALERSPEADLAVGLEGGIEDIEGTLMAFAWAVVRGSTGAGKARTASFALPPEIARLVRSGVELGAADDQVFGRTDSKHREGAVGLLTRGAIGRAELYAPAVLLAMVPFTRPELYGGGDRTG